MHGFTTRLVCSALLTVAWASHSRGADERAEFATRPCAADVRVLFGDDGRLTGRVRAAARAAVVGRIRTVFGASWQAEVNVVHRFGVEDADDLARLANTLSRGEAPAYDKRFLLAVLPAEVEDPLQRLRILAVERDTATGHVGAVVTRRTGRVDALGTTLFAALHDAYAPVATLTSLDGTTAELEPLAVAFTRLDRSAAAVRQGTVLVPFLRYFDRDGTLLRVQPVPWTYLAVESVEDSRVRATVLSGYRAPLGTRVGRRVQVVGLAVRARSERTRVVLVRRGDAPVPAAGTRVEVVKKKLPSDEPTGEPVELLSDRDGAVSVPRPATGGFAWLYVRSGSAVVARVPILPGATRELRLEVPDDSPRLEVEGGIERLNARLIDAVAARETLVRRIRVLARDADWENVDPLLAELGALPTIDSLNDELDRLHTRPLERAKQSGNVRAAFQIEKQVAATRDRVRRFLDPEKIVRLKADVEELRKLDAEDATRFELD